MQGYPDGTQVDYYYDAENQIVEMKDFDGGITKFVYDGNGNKTFKEYPNYETAYYFYDECSRIIEMDEYNVGGKKLYKTTYGWDAEGNRLSEMPKGLNTNLYQNFEKDGVEISGGEAQKIALARALYKDAPFVILDEPTAALDPLAEYEIYSKFNEIIGEKTAVYISHRLSSCRFCSDIAVFDKGRLVQRGSHDSLVADENGKYYELWNAQAQYYA